MRATARELQICFQTIVLYGCNIVNVCDMNALFTENSVDGRSMFYVQRPEQAPTGKRRYPLRRVISDSVWTGIAGAPTCYMSGRLLKDVVIFWKLFYRGGLEMSL
jgi:hypothetical protein